MICGYGSFEDLSPHRTENEPEACSYSYTTYATLSWRSTAAMSIGPRVKYVLNICLRKPQLASSHGRFAKFSCLPVERPRCCRRAQMVTRPRRPYQIEDRSLLWRPVARTPNSISTSIVVCYLPDSKSKPEALGSSGSLDGIEYVHLTEPAEMKSPSGCTTEVRAFWPKWKSRAFGGSRSAARGLLSYARSNETPCELDKSCQTTDIASWGGRNFEPLITLADVAWLLLHHA